MFCLIDQEFPMSAPFRGASLKCKICGSAFRVPPSRANSAEFCSTKCAAVVRGLNRRKRVTLNCEQCSKPFEVPASHKDRRKFCSAECREASVKYATEKSERAKGPTNPMWMGGLTKHSEGYVYELAPDHPFASNGYVFQHRLVMERWLRANEPTSPFLIKLGEQLYLSPEFIVHHDDEDREHNEVGNLVCMTIAEHNKLHDERRKLQSMQNRSPSP